MSGWTDRILREFPSDLSRLWIAADPDNLLLDGHMLASLRERGFDVLPFEDSIAFRVEYEEKYRTVWDHGDAAQADALILQHRSSNPDDLPWDYLRYGRRVSLSLANLFPKLSYSVVRQVGSEHYEAIFDALAKYAPQPLGEGETKNFILTHIFSISPYLISRHQDLWQKILQLHYRGDGLPPVLSSHVASVLHAQGLFVGLPIADLLVSKSLMVRLVQDAWSGFLADCGVEVASAPVAESDNTLSIPFEHPDVRVFIDSMFLEGTLQPVPVKGTSSALPDWAKVGIVDDPNAMAQLVVEGAMRIAAELPDINVSHREWAQFAGRLGETIHRFHSLPQVRASTVEPQIHRMQQDADERLHVWVAKHYTDLPSLPPAKGPVMVHHVPRYLALRRDMGEARIALVVFDGMAMDQWVQIRECLAQRAPDLAFEENACFAWLPTLTSVSRQALFSGLRPREFASSIETTAQEATLWARFWADNGLNKNSVTFRKAIKRTEQLADLGVVIADPVIKVAGIVVDTIDELVHGAVLGKRGIATQIAEWCESGFVEKLFRLLLAQGYSTYLTADHGNVEAVGVGRLNQGVASELRGERVRTYRSATLADSAPEDIDAFRFDVAGLPADYLPLYAGTRGAFVPKGEQIVAHGGMSVEELIVPFVKVSVVRKDQ